MILDKMFELVTDPCHIVVEIGALRGGWTKRCLTALPDAHVYCVDPWDLKWDASTFKDIRRKTKYTGDDMYSLWIKNVSFAFDRVHSVRLTSEKAEKVFPLTIDFLFIDGWHGDVERDLRWWWPKLRNGGLLVGHDIKMKVVKKGADRFFGVNRYNVDAIYKDDGRKKDRFCFWKIKK
jgi:predicted O-methyltransferase YrrM